MKEVIITHAWEGSEPNKEVISLCDFLRKNGFDTDFDAKLAQEETSKDFSKMMHQIMTDYQKVIVVLSKKYKEKAEKFDGGVGEEYAYIIKDIERCKNKYILVSFGGKHNEITPLKFFQREVIDLTDKAGRDYLLAKLQGDNIYSFSPIGSKPKTKQKDIPDLELLMEEKTLKTRKQKAAQLGSSIRSIDSELEKQDPNCIELRCLDFENTNLIENIVQYVSIFESLSDKQLKRLKIRVEMILLKLQSYLCEPEQCYNDELFDKYDDFDFDKVYKRVFDYINTNIVKKCNICNAYNQINQLVEQLEQKQ